MTDCHLKGVIGTFPKCRHLFKWEVCVSHSKHTGLACTRLCLCSPVPASCFFNSFAQLHQSPGLLFGCFATAVTHKSGNHRTWYAANGKHLPSPQGIDQSLIMFLGAGLYSDDIEEISARCGRCASFFWANLFSNTYAGRTANSFDGGSSGDCCRDEVENVCGSSLVSTSSWCRIGLECWKDGTWSPALWMLKLPQVAKCRVG